MDNLRLLQSHPGFRHDVKHRPPLHVRRQTTTDTLLEATTKTSNTLRTLQPARRQPQPRRVKMTATGTASRLVSTFDNVASR